MALFIIIEIEGLNFSAMPSRAQLIGKQHSHSCVGSESTIDNLCSELKSCRSAAKGSELIFSIIAGCYGSKEKQLYLCRNLEVPFSPGPVTCLSIEGDDQCCASGHGLWRLDGSVGAYSASERVLLLLDCVL